MLQKNNSIYRLLSSTGRQSRARRVLSRDRLARDTAVVWSRLRAESVTCAREFFDRFEPSFESSFPPFVHVPEDSFRVSVDLESIKPHHSWENNPNILGKILGLKVLWLLLLFVPIHTYIHLDHIYLIIGMQNRIRGFSWTTTGLRERVYIYTYDFSFEKKIGLLDI